MILDFFKKKNNNRGVTTFSIVLVLIILFLILFFALIIPVLIRMSTDMYVTAQDNLIDANTTASEIKDPEIRQQVLDSLSQASESYETNTDILSTFFQYSWIIIIVVTVLIVFIYSRQSVETTLR